jgi:hypothetical protein
MNHLADLVQNNKGHYYLITEIETNKSGHYMFYLYNLHTSDCEKWFEPFDKRLNPGFWETLA